MLGLTPRQRLGSVGGGNIRCFGRLGGVDYRLPMHDRMRQVEFAVFGKSIEQQQHYQYQPAFTAMRAALPVAGDAAQRKRPPGGGGPAGRRRGGAGGGGPAS